MNYRVEMSKIAKVFAENLLGSNDKNDVDWPTHGLNY
jgi:hypothetical protein